MTDNGRTLTAELKEMQVYGETRVGWDANVPVNETVDGDGNVPSGGRGFGVADPNSPKRRVYDDPEVEALRAKLREQNGSRGLEIWETLTPDAQKLCEWIKAEPGVWPAGAGIMHPLASKREAAKKSKG